MKRITAIISFALVMSIALVCMSSCSILDMSSSAGGNNSGGAVNEDYMTKEEVEKLISGIEQNVTVEGGDSYDITINQPEGSSVSAAASKALLSVVSIRCKFNVTVTYSSSIFGPSGTYTTEETTAGAGVIYSLDKEKGDAYIITNYHVVFYSGADTEDDISDNISVFLYGQEYEQYAISADYIGGSKNYDIAVLKVKNSDILRASSAMAAEFADSNDTCILDTAIAIGNPEAKGISATVGVVNVDSEHITISSIGSNGYTTLRVLRIDAAVNGGNSGGGLFNGDGKLIGIVNAKMSDSSIDNIGYAIPSNIAKYVADNIIYYDGIDAKNDNVYRIMIGVTVGVDKAYTKYDTETGRIHKYEDVKIESVAEGSLAATCLKAGDIVKSITIDGVDYEIVRSFNLIDVMLTARKDSSVVFHIVREGTPMDIILDLTKVEPTPY